MRARLLLGLGACLALTTIFSSASSPPAKVSDESAAGNVGEKWTKMEQKVVVAVESISDKITPFAMEFFGKVNISRQCMRQSLKLMKGLRHLKPWALKFLDSTGKLVDGVLEGNFFFLGYYDECLDIKVPSRKHDDKPLFQGKYCGVDIILPLPKTDDEWTDFTSFIHNFTAEDSISNSFRQILSMFEDAVKSYLTTPRTAVCVPSGCSKEDVSNVAQLIGDSIDMNVRVRSCEIKARTHFSAVHIAIIVFLSTLGLLVLVGTVLDIYFRYKAQGEKSRTFDAILAFSLITNVSNLLDVTGSHQLQSLYGIRFITICWIICAHTFIVINVPNFASSMKYKGILEAWFFQVIAHNMFSVDTFFFLGAFLVSRSFFQSSKSKNKRFNYFMYILNRLFRFWPSYILYLALVEISLLMVSGPSVEDALEPFGFSGSCRKKGWWKNLLFIINYDRECRNHLWYLSVDFQLYVLAPIILIPLKRWPKLGFSLSILGVLVSVITSGIEGYHHSWPTSPAATFVTYEQYHRRLDYYMTPLSHVSPYCIGILTGYFTAKRPNIKIPVKIQVVGWFLSTVSALSLLYGPINWDRGFLPPMAVRMMHHCFSVTIWSLMVAWCVLCCVTGNGGFVNRFLSWAAFVPLGRLTFMTYLFHYLIMKIYVGSLRIPMMATRLIFVWLFFAYFVASYLTAFGCSMLVELPCMTLWKMVSNRKPDSQKQENSSPPEKASVTVNNLAIIDMKTPNDNLVQEKTITTETV